MSDTCAEHGDPLIHEPGGPDMPTLRGRTYCPTCQERFMRALDSQPPRTTYQSPAWWCIRCDTPHYVGGDDQRCDDCGWTGDIE